MKYALFRRCYLMAVLAAALLAAPLLASANPIHYTANLTPLNNSGVSGTAALTLNNSTLNVHITATGLLPNKPHPQHIHGLFDMSSGQPIDSTTPTLAQDSNGDGVIELGEGATTYGPILVPLTSPPGGQVNNFPTASTGSIDFTETYDLNNSGIFNKSFDKDDLMPLTFREIVLHGANTPVDISDNLQGNSYQEGQYDPVFPVASGEIVSMSSVPEPASIGMLMIGLTLVLGFWQLRRNRS